MSNKWRKLNSESEIIFEWWSFRTSDTKVSIHNGLRQARRLKNEANCWLRDRRIILKANERCRFLLSKALAMVARDVYPEILWLFEEISSSRNILVHLCIVDGYGNSRVTEVEDLKSWLFSMVIEHELGQGWKRSYSRKAVIKLIKNLVWSVKRESQRMDCRAGFD